MRASEIDNSDFYFGIEARLNWSAGMEQQKLK